MRGARCGPVIGACVAGYGSKVLVPATTRQVFNNYSGGTLLDISESAYSVWLAKGPEVTF
jgi:hypothetical protein